MDGQDTTEDDTVVLAISVDARSDVTSVVKRMCVSVLQRLVTSEPVV